MESETQKNDASFDNQEDWFLQTLVEFVSSDVNSHIGISVATNGFIVSGLLVSAQRYFMGVAEQTRNSTSVSSGFAEFLEKTGENYKLDFSKRAPIYYHLENASIMSTQKGALKIKFWRGRITEVSALTLETWKELE